jgi:hypothetical protein
VGGWGGFYHCVGHRLFFVFPWWKKCPSTKMISHDEKHKNPTEIAAKPVTFLMSRSEK